MASQFPFLLCTTDNMLAFGNTLLLPSSTLSPQVRASTTPVVVERVLGAFRFPHLPDFLTSPHLTGANERERIAEVLERQTRLIANLAKWKGIGFALRYLTIPERGAIEITLILRGFAQPGRAQFLGEQIASDVTALFQANEITIEPITDDATLHATLQPFTQPTILEIRQREMVVALQLGDAYVVYPFRATLSPWLTTCSTLLAQRAPVAISIYLEPTRLFSEEQQSFAQAASIADTLADFQYRGMAIDARIADPQARIVGRLYQSYLQRLTDPFILAVQIASPDAITAHAVAQILGAEITETGELVNADNAPLPSGFDVIAPQNADEYHAAMRMFTALDGQMWGASEASPGKERLRYLVDARGASTAFRFPIAVRGGIPGIKTRQVKPAYETGTRVETINENEIALGRFENGGIAAIPLNLLTRHALIAGTTGSGKTTTCFYLLSELWKRKIPFLVIDPAKTEYRVLLESPLGPTLQIFTLGDESVSPFRMNPLEILPGVRVEKHISALKACFQAALPQFGILPSLIEESLYNIYLHKNWSLTDCGKVDDTRAMPTLGEMYHEIIRIVEARGYSDKILQDIRAAAAGRIGTLLHGSKGRMLNTRRSIPMDLLMTRPTLLELEALNDEEKSLVMLFLLTRVREYARGRSGSSLAHVTVIEEAHRLAAATAHASDPEISVNTRASGAEALSMTLSEIRAYGEGLIIVEQIPGRLIADALKNTNLKIVHRLPGADDRKQIGGTMNFGIEQETFLTKLAQGQAAFFTEGFEKPTFITVPNYRAEHNLPERIADERVEQAMKHFHTTNPAEYPFDGCAQCVRQCQYRDLITGDVYELRAAKKFADALAEAKDSLASNPSAIWRTLVQTCRDLIQRTALKNDSDAAFCVFVHLWGQPITPESANQFRQAFQRLVTGG